MTALEPMDRVLGITGTDLLALDGQSECMTCEHRTTTDGPAFGCSQGWPGMVNRGVVPTCVVVCGDYLATREHIVQEVRSFIAAYEEFRRTTVAMLGEGWAIEYADLATKLTLRWMAVKSLMDWEPKPEAPQHGVEITPDANKPVPGRDDA